MSTMTDYSRTDGPRLAHAPATRQTIRSSQCNSEAACAHPWVLGSLATFSMARFVLSPTRAGLAQPLAMGVAGWLGARSGRFCGGDHAAIARLLGAAVGAATASAVAQFLEGMRHCQGSAAACWASALFGAASGGCSTGIGGLLGASSWSGWAAPVSNSSGCLVAGLVGAYALGGLSL